MIFEWFNSVLSSRTQLFLFLNKIRLQDSVPYFFQLKNSLDLNLSYFIQFQKLILSRYVFKFIHGTTRRVQRSLWRFYIIRYSIFLHFYHFEWQLWWSENHLNLFEFICWMQLIPKWFCLSIRLNTLTKFYITWLYVWYFFDGGWKSESWVQCKFLVLPWEFVLLQNLVFKRATKWIRLAAIKYDVKTLL